MNDSMTYNELVEKIKVHEPVMTTDINAEQMFKLYEERYLKYIDNEGAEYELNMIALNDESHIYDLVKSDDTWNAFVSLMKKFIKNTKEHKRSFIIVEHKEYEVILELMVSNE